MSPYYASGFIIVTLSLGDGLRETIGERLVTVRIVGFRTLSSTCATRAGTYIATPVLRFPARVVALVCLKPNDTGLTAHFTKNMPVHKLGVLVSIVSSFCSHCEFTSNTCTTRKWVHRTGLVGNELTRRHNTEGFF